VSEEQAAKFIKEVLGDDVGSIFICKTLMLRQCGRMKSYYTINLFNDDDLVTSIYEDPRLDQACMRAIMEFKRHLKNKQEGSSSE
jgi:hypothetical protein